MTEPARETRKTTVEECCSLDIGRLAITGALKQGAYGIYSWTDQLSKRDIASVSLRTTADDKSHILNVEYRLNGTGYISHKVPIQSTFPHFGGERYWFTCSCGRRVGKLYLQGRKLACRICCDLTYTSCQQSGYMERLLSGHGYDGRLASSKLWDSAIKSLKCNTRAAR